jgi:hypothetical protein
MLLAGSIFEQTILGQDGKEIPHSGQGYSIKRAGVVSAQGEFDLLSNHS